MRIKYSKLEAFLKTFHGVETGPRFLIISWNPECLEQIFVCKEKESLSIDFTRLFWLRAHYDTEVKFAMEQHFWEDETRCCENCVENVTLDHPDFTKYSGDACDHSYQELDFLPLLVPCTAHNSFRELNDLFRHNNVDWLTQIRTGGISAIHLTHRLDGELAVSGLSVSDLL